MCDAIIKKYGYEHSRTIAFFREVEKKRPLANYRNREFMERLFKGWMKYATSPEGQASVGKSPTLKSKSETQRKKRGKKNEVDKD